MTSVDEEDSKRFESMRSEASESESIVGGVDYFGGG
jgi:hypothetical protein